MLFGTLFTLLVLAQPLPEVGPIYETLEAMREANPQSPAEEMQWAETILRALDENPNEEWSTRIRAYETAGSVYWRNNDYEAAAPIFLQQMQESEQRGDNGESVRSLDNLINLYEEAKFPAQDVLDFYDATEAWLQNPPPGEEANYGNMLHELHRERVGRLEKFAREANSAAERQAYEEQAAYFEQLAQGMEVAPREITITLADIAQHWFDKKAARAENAVPVEGEPAPAPSAAPPKVAPTPKSEPPLEPLAPLPPLEKGKTPAPPPAPPAGGIPTDVIIGACAVVILAGWGLAAYLYLRRNR